MQFPSERYIKYFPLANIFIHAFCNLSISIQLVESTKWTESPVTCPLNMSFLIQFLQRWCFFRQLVHMVLMMMKTLQRGKKVKSN